MSTKRRIKFPKWTNRPRRFIIYEMDEVYVCVGCAGSLYLTFMLFAVNLYTSLIVTASITFIVTKAYKKYKDTQSKGVLYYWAFSKNIVRPKEDPKIFSDCKHVEGLPRIFIGYEVHFKD